MDFASLNFSLGLLEGITQLLQIHLPRKEAHFQFNPLCTEVPVLSSAISTALGQDRDVFARAPTLRSPHSARGHKASAELSFLPASDGRERRNSRDLQTLSEQGAQILRFNELLSPWLAR